MKKTKFFLSVLKERDWLEEMAAKGYILKNITMGICYDFEETEPCEKVYEIERFAVGISGEADKEELTAKRNALDIAGQMGWQPVAHDESMNYYFVKDKAGDETDEFYNDEESRRRRAERYRKAYAIDTPKQLLGMLLGITVIYLLLFLICMDDIRDLSIWMGIFIAVSILEVLVSFYSMKAGEIMYRDLVLSRQQWEEKKKYSEKKSFGKAEELIGYLNGKDREGLELAGCKEGYYLFRPTKKHYLYYLDTYAALEKRRKAMGQKVKIDKKDISGMGTSWQEQSMEEAEKQGLEVVRMSEYGTLIYRKNAENPEITWNEKLKRTGFGDAQRCIYYIALATFIVGVAAGILAQI